MLLHSASALANGGSWQAITKIVHGGGESRQTVPKEYSSQGRCGKSRSTKNITTVKRKWKREAKDIREGSREAGFTKKGEIMDSRVTKKRKRSF